MSLYFSLHAQMRLLERYGVSMDRMDIVTDTLHKQIRVKEPITWYGQLTKGARMYECSMANGRKVYPIIKGNTVVTIISDNKQSILTWKKQAIKLAKRFAGWKEHQSAYMVVTSIPYNGIDTFTTWAISRKQAIRKLSQEHPYAYFKTGVQITKIDDWTHLTNLTEHHD